MGRRACDCLQATLHGGFDLYCTPAVKAGGRLVARLRTEDDSLVLHRVPPDERDMLMEMDPRVFTSRRIMRRIRRSWHG